MIENSVKWKLFGITRLVLTCRMMPNSYPKWQNFQFISNNHYTFFFLHAFPSKIVLIAWICISLSILRCNNFLSKNVWFASYLRHPEVLHKVVLHRWYKTQISRMGKIMENLVGYARICMHAPNWVCGAFSGAKVKAYQLKELNFWQQQRWFLPQYL